MRPDEYAHLLAVKQEEILELRTEIANLKMINGEHEARESHYAGAKCMRCGKSMTGYYPVNKQVCLECTSKTAAPEPVSKSVQRRLAIQAAPEPKVEESCESCERGPAYCGESACCYRTFKVQWQFWRPRVRTEGGK